MGKSTAATMLRRLGYPVFDSDAAVHRLMAVDGAAVAAIEAAFPGATGADGAIDRKRLGARVFGDRPALTRLEAILHPLVKAARGRFLAKMRRLRMPLVVLDVPLLYETGADAECHAVIVVSAPPFLQRQRVMARPGMTLDRLTQILTRQMPDRLKRVRTPYVVETGLSRAHSLKMLRRFVRLIQADT
jgi:dephospho-CoA kinase